ncbi:glutaredoxin family protein [Lentzea sp. NEAU-D7]|uniref:glutaredoxin family protein n=1 Tax=Lentzea sp. NEAU-D7 TaxID=2994667 RepID=UPI00224AF18C|nr:glutaredoxin family protein [Lentzea sp. NEAU-D7]MCX2955004.1 glutaredoxin family protein [Lentzea sp. NEAU-D7]
MSEQPIVMYGAEWCGDCRRAKSWLTRNNVPFTYVDVEHDDEARDRAIELSGRKNIPVLVLPDGDVLVEPTDTQLSAAIGVQPLA